MNSLPGTPAAPPMKTSSSPSPFTSATASGGETRQHLTTPIGPDHFQAVHPLCSTEPEVFSVVHCGHVPPVGRMIEILLLSPRRQDQLGADAPSVGGLPVEPDLQIVMDVVIGLDVLVNRGRRVDVIDHEIELAVVIEIRIGRAIRKAPSIHAPWLCHVRERQVTLVLKQVVREVVTGQLLQESQRPAIVSGPARP